MTVSVRVIDCVYGKPAIGVPIRLSSQIDGTWTEQWRDKTGEDGRASTGTNTRISRGACRLEFDLDGYFVTLGAKPFYPIATISLQLSEITNAYRVALLITPFAYTVFKED
jgi:5-hydroxyisourate hydrolase